MDKLSFQALRTEKGLNQDDIAKALGISRQAVHNKETGKSEFTFAELIVLSKLYGCSLDLFRHP